MGVGSARVRRGGAYISRHDRARHRLIVAVLSSGSYILFLTALRVLPVNRAAPLRESSVLVGTLLGAHVLAERSVVSRIAAATAILIRILLLSLG